MYRVSTCLALSAVIACSSTPAPPVSGVQPDAGDNTATDVSVSEAPDSAPADIAGDSSTPDDGPATEPDAGPEPLTCESLAATYTDLAAGVGYCQGPGECQWQSNVVCGVCFVPVNKTADLTELKAAEAAFSDAKCVLAPFIPTCCDVPPTAATFGCSDGTCQPCEYVCNMDCECQKDPAGCDLEQCIGES